MQQFQSKHNTNNWIDIKIVVVVKQETKQIYR